MDKKDLPKAFIGHTMFIIGGAVIVPALIYVVMFLIEPFVVFGFGGWLLWLTIKKK